MIAVLGAPARPGDRPSHARNVPFDAVSDPGPEEGPRIALIRVPLVRLGG